LFVLLQLFNFTFWLALLAKINCAKPETLYANGQLSLQIKSCSLFSAVGMNDILTLQFLKLA